MKPTPAIRWECLPFEGLQPLIMYSLLQLRTAVFVVEQNCVFQDMDNHDQAALHLLGWDEEGLVACARLLPAGITYKEASIGRVATALRVRGKRVGRNLMSEAIDAIEDAYHSDCIKIGAQEYLRAFYESFGFVQCGLAYLEDGIPHIPMLRKDSHS